MERQLFGGRVPSPDQVRAAATREKCRRVEARDRRIRRLFHQGFRVMQIARLVGASKQVVGRVLGTRTT
jgi:hypothetical protein